jgi:hypothetical protein
VDLAISFKLNSKSYRHDAVNYHSRAITRIESIECKHNVYARRL